ncbi:MAG: VOC family protein [Bacteroidales bacterium]
MKYIILISIVLFLFNSGPGQDVKNEPAKAKNMDSKFLGLRTASYLVDDISEAKNWYTSILGIQPYFDEPYYVGFNVGGYELGLMPHDTIPKEKVESVVVYWGVEDIEKSYQELMDAGATEYEKPMNVGGELMVAKVKDPWGNIFGIIYNPYFKL